MVTIKLTEAIAMRPQTLSRALKKWWPSKLEEHYLMAACVEQQKASEALRNSAHYQKLAGFARANKNRV